MVTSCGSQKLMTPNLIDRMNLAVTQHPSDHDSDHPRIQKKGFYEF